MPKGTVISKRTARRMHRKAWCNHPGCGKPAEAWEVTPPDGTTTTNLYLCVEHMKLTGHCLGCGYFWADMESFDFGSMDGYCENCVDEFKFETGEYDDDGWDDEFGFMDPYYDTDDDDQPASFDWDGGE